MRVVLLESDFKAVFDDGVGKRASHGVVQGGVEPVVSNCKRCAGGNIGCVCVCVCVCGIKMRCLCYL